MAAVEQDGGGELQWASEALRNDREVVLAALEDDGRAPHLSWRRCPGPSSAPRARSPAMRRRILPTVLYTRNGALRAGVGLGVGGDE